MADIVNTEFAPEGNKIKEVKEASKVRLQKGSLYLNAGHTSDIQKEYSPALESNIATIYKVPEVVEGGKVVDLAQEVSQVDLNKLSGSLLVYNENFMHPFMNIVKEQLKSDLITAQSAKTLVEYKMAENLRFVRAKRKLMHNIGSVMAFLDKLDQLDEFDSVETFRGEIMETVKTAQETFGKRKRFGVGSAGWTYTNPEYTEENKPKPKVE